MPEIPIKEALNKAYIKVRPERAAIERFKSNFIALLDGIRNNPTESEEFLKNLFSDFLKNTWYSPGYFINTHQRVDLVIHTGPDTSSPVGVIIETKKPANKNEMVSPKNLNVKAMQELLLYYLRETIDNDNLNLKYLIITNTVEWFIFDARDFYHCFSQNKELIKLYSDFKTGSLLEKDNTFFYSQIAAPYIKANEKDLNYTYFNITEYEKIIRNQDKKEEDNKLIRLYKLLSPSHLLKLPFANDSNTLNQNFYFELLYLIGLTEDKEEGKKVIVRNQKTKRQATSLIENTIFQLSDDIADEEILFDIALELNITWIDRILFLKLLEAQQLQYQNGSLDYAFLNIKTIKTFNDLNTLFFKVLAVLPQKREEKIKDKYKYVPYLNSSLFEKTENERDHTLISNLQNEEIDVFSSTVLKDETGNKRRGKINILEYIFEFLDAYDFSSEGSEEIQEQNKTLINASVLGLIFEKINGYKDGSYFTPGFITSFICSETIKNVVIDKFNAIKGWNAKTLNDIYNKINTDDIAEANKIINSITILDPAVGSGHFLVSALNEIIAVKSELGILMDNEGRRIKDYFIKVYNDELLIYDENNNFFEYNYKNREKQRIQETIFQEKRRIIENSLFGVDLNRNSVKICRLRLWIELLKNAYYTKESEYTELETLPNLDINIKPGNSLISRFDLDIDLKNNLSGLEYTVKDYQEAVYNYKNSTNKSDNKKLLDIISKIKNDFAENSKKQNVLFTEKANLEKRLAALGADNMELDFVTEKQLEDKQKKIQKIQDAILKKETEISNFMNGVVYDDAFEWRFEFPEVLDADGNFIGFDAVIGNPPYLRIHEILIEEKDYYKETYHSASSQFDLYQLFYEKGLKLIKKHGYLSFITSNKFCVTNYGRKLRELLVERYKVLSIVDVSNIDVFKEAATYPYIMFLQNSFEHDNKVKMSRSNKITNDTILFDQSTEIFQENLLTGENKNIDLNFNTAGSSLVRKIEKTGSSNALSVYRGRGTSKDLISKKETNTVLSITNRQIIGYILSNDVFYRNKNTYPNDFDVKILMKKICYNLEASLDDTGKINPINTVYVIKTIDPSLDIFYVLGILCSKLLTYYARTKYLTTHMRGGYIELRVFEVEKLPIFVPNVSSKKNNNNYEKIIKLVKEIIGLKKNHASNDMTYKKQKEIDDIVYSLYQLTPEEIEIVNRIR
jgi:CRISPR/Cas system-associated exonuclease Cas4 (RecB family)